jgi:hypothetical protein
MSEERTPVRERGLPCLFIAIYLFLQITLPIFGLYAAHRMDQPVRLSWHMYSRIPAEVDE